MRVVARITIGLLVSLVAAGCAFETESDRDAHLEFDDESFVEDGSLDEFARDDFGQDDFGRDDFRRDDFRRAAPSYGDELGDEVVEMPPRRLGSDASLFAGESQGDDEDNPEPQPWRLDATSDNPEPQPWDELSHDGENPEPQPWEDDVAESDQNPEPQPWRGYAAATRGTSGSTSSSGEPTPQPW